MGAVRMSPNSWLKHHNNPHHSSPSVNVMWSEKLRVCNWIWITCGLLWCFYQLFGLILTAPIHCRASISETVMSCHISPNLFWYRSKLIYILDDLRVSTFSTNLNFIKEDLTCCLKRSHANLEDLQYLLIRVKDKMWKSMSTLLHLNWSC